MSKGSKDGGAMVQSLETEVAKWFSWNPNPNEEFRECEMESRGENEILLEPEPTCLRGENEISLDLEPNKGTEVELGV
jgi:hypothetical protein